MGNMTPPNQSKLLNHLGLVAGMYDELNIGEIVEQMIPR